MARNVTINTIGGPYPQVDAALTHAEMWDKVKEYWTKQVTLLAPDKPDLIVFTEMCDLPFPSSYKMDFAVQFAEKRGNDNLNYFSRMAKDNRCNVSFTTVARGKGDYFTNTMFLMDRSGKIAGQYDKYYVTGGENDASILYGGETPVFKLDFGTAACAICFDLNFEDLRDRYKNRQVELIIFASQFHGGLMQQMWANTIRAFFVGAIAHQQPSAVLSPLGETVAYSTDYYKFATAKINLDYALVHLKEKEASDAMKRKYGAGITLYDPCHLGYFMLTNEMPGVSVQDLLKEFGITAYGDYMDESRLRRNKDGNRGASAAVSF